MAKIYKSISYTNRDSRPYTNLNETDLQKVNNIIQNFKSYFISKHLS